MKLYEVYKQISVFHWLSIVHDNVLNQLISATHFGYGRNFKSTIYVFWHENLLSEKKTLNNMINILCILCYRCLYVYLEWVWTF